MRILRQLLMLAVIVAMAGIYVYLAYFSAGDKQIVSATDTKKVEKAPSAVVVAQVEQGDVTREITAVGAIDAEYRIQVIAEMAGKLLSLEATEGVKVREGDVVAEVEHDLIDMQVRQAQAGLEMAQIAMRKAVLDAQRAQARAGLEAALAGQSQVRTNKANLEKERNRIRKLHEDGLVSESNLDAIETQLTSLTDQESLVAAQVSQAKAGLALLEAQLEDIASARRRQAEVAVDLAMLQKGKASVKAPRSGMVNRRHVEIGDMVGPTRPLFEIVGIDRVKVAVDLPETLFGRIKAGETVAEISVDAWPGREPFKGVISKVGPSLNPMSRSVPVEVMAENPGHALRPGMSARVRVIPEIQAGVLKVPLDAVVSNGGDKAVFVLSADSATVRKVVISTGLSSDAETEVLSGLSLGERVVVRGNIGLRDGSAVTLLKGE